MWFVLTDIQGPSSLRGISTIHVCPSHVKWEAGASPQSLYKFTHELLSYKGDSVPLWVRESGFVLNSQGIPERSPLTPVVLLNCQVGWAEIRRARKTLSLRGWSVRAGRISLPLAGETVNSCNWVIRSWRVMIWGEKIKAWQRCKALLEQNKIETAEN